MITELLHMQKWFLGILTVLILGVGLFIISIASPDKESSSNKIDETDQEETQNAETGDTETEQGEDTSEKKTEKENNEEKTTEGSDQPDEEDTKSEDTNDETSQPTPPTERTVDIGDAYPWEQLGVQAQRQEVLDGGQVYLMRDAEALEEKLLSFIEKEPSDSYDKMGAAQAWSKQTKTYVLDLEEFYPGKADYFQLMDEASQHLTNGDFDKAKNKIMVARTKR